jgi:hypothetical protein
MKSVPVVHSSEQRESLKGTNSPRTVGAALGVSPEKKFGSLGLWKGCKQG